MHNYYSVLHTMDLYTHKESWLIEAHVEGQGKGGEEQNDQHNQPTEGDEDVDQHDHVDSKHRKLSKVHHQVNPGEKDGHSAELPLP